MKLRELGLAAGAFALLAAAASAQTVYEKRTAYMKGLGASMGAIGKYVKGEAAYSPAVAEAGQKIKAHSIELVGHFPKDTVGDSRAKPEIWAKWADFETKAKEFEAAAAQLATATQSDDKATIAAAQQATGKTCGGCHDTFRAPKKS